MAPTRLLCSTCQRRLFLSDFADGGRENRYGKQYNCRECSNGMARKNYHANKDRYFRNAKKRDVEMRTKVSKLKSNPCADCGRTFPPIAMDWDHLDGTGKLFEISAMLRHRMAWWKIEEELAKCELVCSNCHRIRTQNRLSVTDSNEHSRNEIATGIEECLLDEVESIQDPVEVAAAAQEFISTTQEVIERARTIRDFAIRELCAQHGPAATARMLGMKLPTVKAINRK